MTTIEILITVLSGIVFWAKLNVLAILLILFRKDRESMFTEMRVMMLRPFPYWFTSGLIIFVMLPITIPYTIAHFIRWKK